MHRTITRLIVLIVLCAGSYLDDNSTMLFSIGIILWYMWGEQKPTA